MVSRAVHCTCTACALHVHCVCTACALHVHCVCTACAHPGLECPPLGRQQRVRWFLHLEALDHQRVAEVGEVEQPVELVPLGLGLGLGFRQGLGF